MKKTNYSKWLLLMATSALTLATATTAFADEDQNTNNQATQSKVTTNELVQGLQQQFQAQANETKQTVTEQTQSTESEQPVQTTTQEQASTTQEQISATTQTTLDQFVIQTNYDYLTVGTQVNLNVETQSTASYSWKVVDTKIGTIENNCFKAKQTGSTEVQLIVNNQVVASKTMHVVVPDQLSFAQQSLNVVNGQSVQIPVTATYQGQAVLINQEDVQFNLSDASLGSLSGCLFKGQVVEASRNVQVFASWKTDIHIRTTITITVTTSQQSTTPIVKNGWIRENGQLFYYKENQKLTGIQQLPSMEDASKQMYFDLGVDGSYQGKYTGFLTIEGKECFIKEGLLLNQAGLFEFAGHFYYINTNGQLIKDRIYYVEQTNHLIEAGFYQFNAQGQLGERVHVNGIFKESDEKWYYYVNDVKTYAGLIQIADHYYYVNSNFEVIHNRSYPISKTNDLLPQGTYTFDINGHLVLSTISQGIVKQADGHWYYYLNGEKYYAGLITINGVYYYINSDFEVIHDRSYTISKTNGLLDQGTYDFDSQGHLILNSVKKEGIVKAADGHWYYYVNGEKTYAGLIQIDGYYYYVNSNFEVIHDQSYFITKTNDIMQQATYVFDAEGHIVQSSINGIVKAADGHWYFYVNGIKTYAGLIHYNGAYYYVNSDFEVIHDRSYPISKTNGLLAQGTYTFDKDGKIVFASENNGNDNQNSGSSQTTTKYTITIDWHISKIYAWAQQLAYKTRYVVPRACHVKHIVKTCYSYVRPLCSMFRWF